MLFVAYRTPLTGAAIHCNAPLTVTFGYCVVRTPQNEERLNDYVRTAHLPWSMAHSFQILSFFAWGTLAGMPLGRSLNVLLRAARAKTAGAAAPSLK